MNIRINVFSFISFLVLLFAGCTSQADKFQNPNIVIIYADDMGYGDAQCYNPGSLIPTPNIDKLASEGMRFTDAHSTSAVCSPSRYSLLTGRYAWRTPLKKHVLWPWQKPLIERDRLTLPEMLKEKGYQTAAIGKWHLGWNWGTIDSLDAKSVNSKTVDYTKRISGGPTELGFDYYFGDDVPNFPPYTFIENDMVTAIPDVMKPDTLFGDKGMMVEGWDLSAVMPTITEKAIDFIHSQNKQIPFFLYFPLPAPHTPIIPLERFQGKSRAGLYGDYVHQVDWVVGEIMRTITEKGFEENTILIFTSDNGSPGRDGNNMSGPVHSVEAYGHLPNGSLHGYKGDIWEGGHRIPFIIKWPGKVRAESVNDELICQVDIIRTIAEITGYELPPNTAEDSYNILPALFEENNEPIRKALVNHSWDGSFAVRKGKWKLIMTHNSGGFGNTNKEFGSVKSVPEGQLYDLYVDLAEENNLYESNPEKVNELKMLLNKYIE